MDKKILLIIVLSSIVIILFAIFIAITQKTSYSPKNTSLEECKNIVYNGENAFNILFFSTKEDAKRYSDFFFQTNPFNENKKYFNVYYIDSFIPDCEIYKGIAILCYSKEVLKKASSCPNDYIVILKKEERVIRSSSYMNVLSINTNHPLSVFSHEFGHSFANFAEEYVPAQIPKGSKNCLFSCKEFGEPKDGCYKECSKSDAYRSIENGVMRTLSSNKYGAYNERLLLEKINRKNETKTTGRVISGQEKDCSRENYYLIEAKYEDNKIKLIHKSIENGCFGDNGAGPFTYKIIKTDNSEIHGTEFNPELIFTDSPGEDPAMNYEINGETYLQERSFFLRVPEIPNSKTLEINLNENKIGEINLFDIGARPCLE